MMGSFAKLYCYSSTMWACMWKSKQTEGRLAIYERAGDSKHSVNCCQLYFVIHYATSIIFGNKFLILSTLLNFCLYITCGNEFDAFASCNNSFCQPYINKYRFGTCYRHAMSIVHSKCSNYCPCARTQACSCFLHSVNNVLLQSTPD